jgi:hypothetical protein
MANNMKGPVGSNGITDANYLFVTLVGDRSKGETPSLPMMEGIGHVLYESPKGERRLVVGCNSFPKMSNSAGFLKDFDGMGQVEIMEEMILNGMGSKMDFADNAYIRVVKSDGKAEPVVFRDYRDALAYLGEN